MYNSHPKKNPAHRCNLKNRISDRNKEKENLEGLPNGRQVRLYPASRKASYLIVSALRRSDFHSLGRIYALNKPPPVPTLLPPTAALHLQPLTV